MPDRRFALALLVPFAFACGEASDAEPVPAADESTTPAEMPTSAEALGGEEGAVSPEELEAGRLDASWRPFADTDRQERRGRRAAADSSASSGASSGARADTVAESWEDIGPDAVALDAVAVPLSGDVAGPSVLAVQVLLDRVRFSPGVMDGRWGKNTEKAVYWFQEAQGMEATGRMDGRTLERLERRGGSEEVARRHTLTASDVEGPFVNIPSGIYARAEMDCLCGHYLHALDEAGDILYHFPTTLGSEYAPSPGGEYTVQAIAWDPTWHYQPELLTGEPDHADDAILPGGPNNAVGVVWMALSKPHYGIHGTKAPETIGYATSHGCVRLTNWDARFLGERTPEGTPVEFRDVTGRE